jgi:drug/metabolite transporter (DMT)-like permease
VSRILTEAVPAALGATVFYNLAPVVQAVAARREPLGRGVGFALLARLIRRPLWLAGFGLELVGFALEVIALSVAPLILVQPLLASGLAIAALASWIALGERFRPVGGVGVMLLAGGVISLTASVAGLQQQPQLPQAVSLGVAVAAAAAVTAGLLWFASMSVHRDWRTTEGALFGAAAGVCFSMSAVGTRYLGVEIHHFSGHALLHTIVGPGPYVLGAFSIVATSLMQRGMQAGAALVAIPTMTALSAVLPVPAGILLFDEAVPNGFRMVMFVASLALTVAGVGVLGTQNTVATPFHDTGRPILEPVDIAESP